MIMTLQNTPPTAFVVVFPFSKLADAVAFANQSNGLSIVGMAEFKSGLKNGEDILNVKVISDEFLQI